MVHMTSTPPGTLTVGFDLDMTLIDSRPGIHACYVALAERTGTSIDAVHAAGGRAIVVTAKYEPNAKLHLEHLGIHPDEVVGNLWAEQKAEALREHGAGIYVGDHVGDVRGARRADALSVAVATGPCSAEELSTAGADVVLGDLTEFPGWLADYPPLRA